MAAAYDRLAVPVQFEAPAPEPLDGCGLAGRQGVSAAAFRNPHKHGAFLISCSGPAI